MSAGHASPQLRVALIAGGLTQGGAEKQLTYMARALQQAGVMVCVFSLTQRDHYQSVLQKHGVPVVWAGQYGSPPQRIATLVRLLRTFRPHIIQSTHFFTNLYAALTGRILRTVSIGSVRSNVFREVKANGMWGPLLLKLPQTLILNSEMARRNAETSGIHPDRLFVLSNVIDLTEFDRPAPQRSSQPVVAVSVARLVKVKRLDLFLSALSIARNKSSQQLAGMLVGDGPERAALESTAANLGLTPADLTFTGLEQDVPARLAQSDLFVLTSETEGFPNSILEAMAAGLPVITTPAGDAPQIVQDAVTGFIVPHNDPEQIARRMLDLIEDPALRRQMGQAGRTRVEQLYSYQSLARRLLDLYTLIARQQNNSTVLQALRRQNIQAVS